jgi:hypothetical protein
MENKNILQKQFIKKSFQGAAIMGKTYAIIGSTIGIALGLFFIIIGSIFHSNKHNIKTQSEILESKCSEEISSFQFNCDFIIRYIFNDKEYTKKITDYNSYSNINVGDRLEIYINPQDPSDLVLQKSPEWLNILLIIVGCFFVFFSLVYVYFIIKYKGLAALSGIKKVVFEG